LALGSWLSALGSRHLALGFRFIFRLSAFALGFRFSFRLSALALGFRFISRLSAFTLGFRISFLALGFYSRLSDQFPALGFCSWLSFHFPALGFLFSTFKSLLFWLCSFGFRLALLLVFDSLALIPIVLLGSFRLLAL
jgi:hypothetical protein